MENHNFSWENRKIHYFYGHFQCRKLLVITRVYYHERAIYGVCHGKNTFHIHMAGLPAPRLRDSEDQTITANEEACRPAICRLA